MAPDRTLFFPPGIRGKRRSNHACSAKSCQNLLSPECPWKTCELCRSRDRARVRSRAARDEECEAEPSSVTEDTALAQRSAQKGKKAIPKSNTASAGSTISSASHTDGHQGDAQPTLVFLDPIVPPDDNGAERNVGIDTRAHLSLLTL